jgi:hypothetical protein
VYCSTTKRGSSSRTWSSSPISSTKWRSVPDLHLEVSHDFDPKKEQERLSTLILGHLQSVREVSQELGDSDLASITISFDVDWRLPREDEAKFFRWLNSPFSKGDLLTRVTLSEGSWTGRAYEFPKNLSEAAASLEDDPSRLLAARAAGTASVLDEDIALTQPDDDFQMKVWPDGPETSSRS